MIDLEKLNPGEAFDPLRPGDEVLIVSNNVAPWVGVLLGWEPIHNQHHPVVRQNGKVFVVFGIVFPAAKCLCEMFEGMTTEAAWALGCEISFCIQCVHRKALGS